MVIDETDISRLEHSLDRLAEKIDLLDTKYLSRTEYEARHATLINDISKLSLEISQKSTWEVGEHNDIRKEMDLRFEKVSDTLDPIQDKFSQDTQKLRDQLASSSTEK